MGVVQVAPPSVEYCTLKTLPVRSIARRTTLGHIRWAEELFRQVEAEPEFEILSPLRFSLFTFRHHPAGMEEEAALDEHNADLVRRINDDGRIYITQNLVRGRYAIRFVVGQTWTERRHVQEAWSVIRELARDSVPEES